MWTSDFPGSGYWNRTESIPMLNLWKIGLLALANIDLSQSTISYHLRDRVRNSGHDSKASVL